MTENAFVNPFHLRARQHKDASVRSALGRELTSQYLTHTHPCPVGGEIELTLADQVFVLQAGDSFSFSADVPHRYCNHGSKQAQIVWANTPVTLKR